MYQRPNHFFHYRDSALEMNHLKGFTIPEWMLTKVKTQMRALRTDSAPVKPKFKGLVNVVQQVCVYTAVDLYGLVLAWYSNIIHDTE